MWFELFLLPLQSKFPEEGLLQENQQVLSINPKAIQKYQNPLIVKDWSSQNKAYLKLSLWN